MQARSWFRVIWITAGLAFFGWLVRGFQLTDFPDEMYRAMPEIEIERYTSESRFLPKANERGVGLIFFPGAVVDPMAYDPLARRVARKGYPVVVIHMEHRLAFGSGATEHMVSQALDKTRKGRWVIGGHSRGGMVASEFAYLHPERVAGLILIGTTHPRDRDLSQARFPAVKIMGSLDGVAPLEKSLANRHLLPPDTRLVTIEGGNHAQFGYYRYQLFDGQASISREEQQSQLTATVLAEMEKIEKEPQ